MPTRSQSVATAHQCSYTLIWDWTPPPLLHVFRSFRFHTHRKDIKKTHNNLSKYRRSVLRKWPGEFTQAWVSDQNLANWFSQISYLATIVTMGFRYIRKCVENDDTIEFWPILFIDFQGSLRNVIMLTLCFICVCVRSKNVSGLDISCSCTCVSIDTDRNGIRNTSRGQGRYEK